MPLIALQSTGVQNQRNLCDTKTWDIFLLPAREEEEPGGSTSPRAGGDRKVTKQMAPARREQQQPLSPAQAALWARPLPQKHPEIIFIFML